ncbi:hypothetical protein BC828DRAFT_372566 [Blastocladiella britannica]|nr:hypothetical protein BC828DRAFT_372566 [Blastocladiella britannica]
MKLLSTLSALALLTLSAKAAVQTRWDFSFGGAGSIGSPGHSQVLSEPGYVEIFDLYCSGDQFEVYDNGVSIGVTSTPVSDGCASSTGSVNDAWGNLKWSRGVFYLAPGSHSITVKAVQSPFGSGGASGIIGTGNNAANFIDQSTIPAWAVVTNGTPNAKVQTRAAAAAICASKGMILAAPTKQTWDAVAAALQSSPAIVAPSSTVIVSSWDGNDYGGADLALTIIKGAKPSVGGLTLAAAPAYPLCQKDPSQTQTPAYQPVTMDSNFAVVGPIGSASQLSDACAKVNMVPFQATGADPAGCKAASSLVFQAAGQNSQAWIGGWDGASNFPYVVSTGATGGSCTVNAGDVSKSQYFVCQKPATGAAKRSEL